jgi:hypothetical protein
LVNKNIPPKRWFKLAVACLGTVTRLIRFAASAANLGERSLRDEGQR